MMLHKDKCLELGLPEPKCVETQQAYIIRAMASGHTLNTRICRYIGVGNLHSIVSSMNKACEFTLGHGRVLCPFTNETPPFPVDIVRMTKEQREAYQAKEKPAKV